MVIEEHADSDAVEEGYGWHGECITRYECLSEKPEMAYEAKTKATEVSVADFVAAVENPKRRADAEVLCTLFEEISGEPPKMWGPSIIGFGTYHYRYDSGHEGDAPRLGFSPRKAQTVVYVMSGFEGQADMIARIAAAMQTSPPPDMVSNTTPWKVYLSTGLEIKLVHMVGGRPTCRIKELLTLIRPGGTFALNTSKTKVTWKTSTGNVKVINVAQIDEKGSPWGYLKEIADVARYRYDVSGNKITLTKI
jgi:hypothetical protein